jgi:hypothetical protein
MSLALPTKTISLPLLAAIYAVLASQSAGPASAQSQVLEGPAGRALQAFLNAFNSADRSQIEVYVKTYDQTQTVDGLLSFRAQTGGFTLLSVESSAPDALSFRVRGNGDNIEAYGHSSSHAQPRPKSNC